MAHLYLSRCYLRQDSPEKAEETYARAVELDGSQKDIYHWISIQEKLGELAAVNGDFQKAIGILENALVEVKQESGVSSLWPADRIYESLAEVYRRKGDSDKAMETYDRAIRMYEDVLVEFEQDEDALIEGERLPPWQEQNIYQSLAGVYRRKGDLDKAIETYERALAKREAAIGFVFFDWYGGVYLHNSLAEVYREKGDTEKAEFHERKSRDLESKGELFSKFSMCTGATGTAGFIQWLVLLLATIVLGVRAAISKRSTSPEGKTLDKVRWTFGDVLAVYIRTFLLPLLVLALILAVFSLAAGGGLYGFYGAAVPLLGLLLGMISMFLFTKASHRHFEARSGGESSELPGRKKRAIFRLSCWQLLSVTIVNVGGAILVSMMWVRVFLLLAR